MDWKHNTMTSDRAQKLARQVVSEQKYSVHNAVRGEAWSEFLLYANGFSVDASDPAGQFRLSINISARTPPHDGSP